MNKNWKILQPDTELVEKISSVMNCSRVAAAVMVNRNIVSPEKASRFMKAELRNLRPPFSMKDTDIAVRRIYDALMKREKILIFGDYDVDGVTGTTLLLEFLQDAGANVSYYIPHRVKEGYNIQPFHISDHAIPKKINLIITVDCGSGSSEAVRRATDAGIDVIITDHHNISGTMPGAVAVVNPKRPDCTAGFDNLAGVGVAFFLLICLRKYLRETDFWKGRREPNLRNFCDLVALGTIADVVPLVDENRILSKTGLELINSPSRPGIKALIKACAISNYAVATEDISFRLAPRLNAAGRMGHASMAVSLLTTDDMEKAREIASSLNLMNQDRQSIERNIFDQIVEYLKEHPHLTRKSTIVLSHPGWHEGILGIVASRVVRRYFRPVILIGTRNGTGKGSGRSIPGVDIHAGLLACANDLEHFGGHPMAAGLTIKSENIPRFQEHFENAIQDISSDGDFIQTISIDLELDFDRITDHLIDELESLEPFGEGNPEPLFMARDIRVATSKIVGKNHRRMTLTQKLSDRRMSRPVNAIQFNINPEQGLPNRFHQIAFRLGWNRWNGRRTAQITLEET